MSRRVRSAAAVLFALTLLIQTPVAFAARYERDRGRAFEPSFVQRIIKVIKQTLKPLGVATNDDEYMPTPPRP
ncbi:MAG TPA: hypothetical protein VM779_10785 [Thermoanaerobaculia bacterium]|nr:hypothetical protein [Thermoanaerobaculia bacterium]